MRTYFIVNNLKVNTFLPHDAPIPGFDLLAWENECFTFGSLWDLGLDAGYTSLGKGNVRGQLWLAENLDSIKELEYFLGAQSGLTEPHKVKVTIHSGNPPLIETLDAIVYRLTKIRENYKLLNTDNWWIKRSGDKYDLNS